jgi:release factor glutamine methyltransferase
MSELASQGRTERSRVDRTWARDAADHGGKIANVLGRSTPAQGALKRAMRAFIHFFSYHFILKRRATRTTRAAGFKLTILPTVFHPRFFVTSEYFAAFVERLPLTGRRVADVGTGTGILALAAARAGAASVAAIDINPNAVAAAAANAIANDLGDRVRAVHSDLLVALPAGERFDVILFNLPFFTEEPRDVADRAWNAGPGYRDIEPFFDQARERLVPGGALYVLLSSDCDFDLLGAMIERAGFRARLAAERSILIESFIIYELRRD